MNIRSIYLAGVAASAFTLASIGTANAVTIDNFDNPTADPFQRTCVGGPSASDCPNTTISSDSYTGAGIIGGTRSVTTTRTATATGQKSETFVSSDGHFTHSQTSGSGATTVITWDAGGAGLGGVDLTDAGGSDAFHIRVVQADLGIEWKLEVFDGDSSDFITFDTSSGGIAPPGVDLYKSFSLFSGIDFTDITKIIFTANNQGVVDVDTTIDLIETVPEPATLSLFGLGLLGLGAAARRRRAA